MGVVSLIETLRYCGTPLDEVRCSVLHFRPNIGTLFILLSMFMAFGYVLAASASDVMVVEYAQRVPVGIRDRI
ncbi:hypothetical protein B5M09_011206 [Aphanomyces astaci]|uniref:Uncharacterized protein n=1 Tax=Aphanomyces astaci TaxID=112090 RepID=A0A425D820_APHAT|nr:hypothetical protein B5M09_011206 [Aphanomyces astaci]